MQSISSIGVFVNKFMEWLQTSEEKHRKTCFWFTTQTTMRKSSNANLTIRNNFEFYIVCLLTQRKNRRFNKKLKKTICHFWNMNRFTNVYVCYVAHVQVTCIQLLYFEWIAIFSIHIIQNTILQMKLWNEGSNRMMTAMHWNKTNNGKMKRNSNTMHGI